MAHYRNGGVFGSAAAHGRITGLNDAANVLGAWPGLRSQSDPSEMFGH